MIWLVCCYLPTQLCASCFSYELCIKWQNVFITHDFMKSIYLVQPIRKLLSLTYGGTFAIKFRAACSVMLSIWFGRPLPVNPITSDSALWLAAPDLVVLALDTNVVGRYNALVCWANWIIRESNCFVKEWRLKPRVRRHVNVTKCLVITFQTDQADYILYSEPYQSVL